MSVRSTSSASQKTQLGDKHKSSGWAWPRLVRAESPKSTTSTSEVSVTAHKNTNPNPASSSASAGRVEDMPPANQTPSPPPAVPRSTVDDRPQAALSKNDPVQEDDPPKKESPKTPGHFIELSSSRETSIPEGPSTPSSPKVFQWEAAKKPQVHEPTNAYKSERTSVAEAARRLELLDQASGSTKGQYPGAEPGVHSALPGVPLSLAQIMGLPRPGKDPQSSGAKVPHNDADVPALERLDESSRDEAHPSVPTAESTHTVEHNPISKPGAFLHDENIAAQPSELTYPVSNRHEVDDPAARDSPSHSSDDEVHQELSSQSHTELTQREGNDSIQLNQTADSGNGERISGSEQPHATHHPKLTVRTTETPVDEPHIPESEHHLPDLPQDEASAADSEPSAGQGEETPVKKRRSFFHRLSKSDGHKTGHKTHAEKKEEQKKEIRAQEDHPIDIRTMTEVLRNDPRIDSFQPEEASALVQLNYGRTATLPEILAMEEAYESSLQKRKESLPPESDPVTEAPKAREAFTAKEVPKNPGFLHDHESHQHTPKSPPEGYPYSLPPPKPESITHDSFPRSSDANHTTLTNTGSEELTPIPPGSFPRNPQNSTVSDATATPLHLRPSSTIPLNLGAPKIVLIRATDEINEPLGTDNTAPVDNVQPKPQFESLPPPPKAEVAKLSGAPSVSPSKLSHRTSGTGLLLEELGNLEVPVQGMIPTKTKIIRRGRCAVLRGPVLQALLGRELARQTKPVLRLMAHGVPVETNADGELQLAQPAGASMPPEASAGGQDVGTVENNRDQDAGRAAGTAESVEGHRASVHEHSAGKIAADKNLDERVEGRQDFETGHVGRMNVDEYMARLGTGKA